MMKLNEWDYESSHDEKMTILNSHNLFIKENEEVLFTIFLNESNPKIYGEIAHNMSSREDFLLVLDTKRLFSTYNSVKSEKQKLIFNIILRRLCLTIKKDDEKTIFDFIKGTKNPIRKLNTVKYPGLQNKFSKNDWNRFFGTKDEIKLFSIEISNRDDLIKEIFNLIELVESSNLVFYSSIKQLISSLSSDDKDSLLSSRLKVPIFLKKALVKLGFPEKNGLFDVFESFLEIEKQLYSSLSNYRDHVVHSLNVFLLGLIILIVKWESNMRINESEYLAWLLTSFFHDVGYGIEKLGYLSSEIKNQVKNLGFIEPSEFKFTRSTYKFTEKIIDLLNELLIPSRNSIKDYKFLKLNPILSSFEKLDHGFVSAIIFLKEIDYLIMNDINFDRRYSKKWDNIFLKSALAMSIHTFPSKLLKNLDIDMKMSKTIHSVNYPLYLAFLLILTDTIEFLDRPLPSFFQEPFKELFRKDIMLNLKMSLDYSFDYYLKIKLNIEYEKIKEDLLITAKRFFKAFRCFSSKTMSLEFELKTKEPKEKSIKFKLLRGEEEEFRKFLEEKNISVEDFKDGTDQLLDSLYFDFFKYRLIDQEFNLDDFAKLVSFTTSYQIVKLKEEYK